jgi:hypothetical protein
MSYKDLTKEQLLTEIDNKAKAIIKMGKQLTSITPNVETFDFLLTSALNRTVNISKAYTSLIRENNFIAEKEGDILYFQVSLSINNRQT